MKKLLKLCIALLFLTLMGFTSLQQVGSSCETLHNGTFTYSGSGGVVKVIIDGKKHIEYHNDGKYFIKSKLEWVNACEYNMTMTKVTIPNFPFGKGDIMNVKIDKVERDQIYYTSTVNGQSWNSMFIKTDE